MQRKALPRACGSALHATACNSAMDRLDLSNGFSARCGLVLLGLMLLGLVLLGLVTIDGRVGLQVHPPCRVHDGAPADIM